METKALLGLLSVFVNFIGYVPYFKDVLQKRTRPHIFTWLVWCILAGIAFAIQVTNDAGAGSWMMGFTTVATLVIFLLALKNGEKNIVLADWLSLAFAGGALVLWFFTKDPLLSIILITVVDVIGGFFPTFHKSYHKPHEETASLYIMYVISWALSLAALEKIDLINSFSAVTFIGVNVALVAFLWIRRLQVGTGSHSPRS
jgi:hypothetical protein